LFAYDPKTSLNHYPGVSLARFGQNPYGENLYRIVSAHSRRYLVVGEWPDGHFGPEWLPLYRRLGNLWIMERWLTAEQFVEGKAGQPVGKEQWAADFAILGEWPSRGDYEICHVFECSPPTDANLGKLIGLIETGYQRRLAETVQFKRDEHERELKARRSAIENKIKGLLPAMGCRVMFSAHVNRGSEKVFGHGSASGVPVERYSANELGIKGAQYRRLGPEKAA
jgi:hypothetical protein